MPVLDTYKKRKLARERAGQPDVYQYEVIGTFLRKQVSIIFEKSLGPWSSYDRVPNAKGYWTTLADWGEREIESFPDRRLGDCQRCLEFIVVGYPVDDWLTFVEFGCRVLNALIGRNRSNRGAGQNADDAIAEINDRFREHAFGYEYRNGEIIRIDDEFIHADVVKPALAALTAPGFEKANEEFMTAHRHYREGSAKDAIVAANRAFEATLKAICKKRGWAYPEGARASELVTTARERGLFPDYLGKGLNTYVALMKTGLPTVRNNAGGHGDHPDAPAVPDYLASYAIHTTAANILLVINADRSE